MLKKSVLSLVIALSFVASSVIVQPVLARTIYEQGNNQANYVKLIKIKGKDSDDRMTTHPVTITEEKMAFYMASLRYNKAALFKDEIKEQRIFIDSEIKKFAPYLTQALSEADADEQVFFSIVAKRPYFIVRNDAINQGYMWVNKDGLHVKFSKLAAKLTGDYAMRGKGEEIVKRSRGLKVSLEVIEGQKLGFEDAAEVVIDMNADWPTILAKYRAGEDDDPTTKSLKKRDREKDLVVKKKNPEDEPIVKANPTSTTKTASSVNTNGGGNSEARLKQLKTLKDQGLISPQDYDLKKKEILKSL